LVSAFSPLALAWDSWESGDEFLDIVICTLNFLFRRI